MQSDGSLLLDVHAPGYRTAREALAPFAQLEKAPEHLHTWRITPVSLWNAAAAGLTAADVKRALEDNARYGVPQPVLAEVEDQVSRWGKLVLDRDPDAAGCLRLTVEDPRLRAALQRYSSLAEVLQATPEAGVWRVDEAGRGAVKQSLARIGYPVVDLAGYTDGAALDVALRETTLGGRPFGLREYQREAIDAFMAGVPGAVGAAGGTTGTAGAAGADTTGTAGAAADATGAAAAGRHVMGGHGVVVLPCGAGKTVVALGVMARLGMHTLVLATGTTAVRQWIAETLDKTGLTEDQVGEYTGARKEVRPVTVATYQIATRERHRALFETQDWGLIVYDEVHLLPAPLFRTTADLQARRRLGLTATLVREDGREAEVFGLIGPKRFDIPWRDLETSGFVATAECVEVRVPGSDALLGKVLMASGQNRYRFAAENPVKNKVAEALVREHRGERILVIGQYLTQLRRLARRLDAPLLTGETPQDERDRLFAAFRAGEQPVLVVSRVANFSVDLPDASVLIQVSGLFGSRQEEAQRLGRILRPKADGRTARFYTLVTPDTPDQRFALGRQRFLTEQGYRYVIRDADVEHPEAMAGEAEADDE